MFTIRQWLEALGLERYINAFEENEITVGLRPGTCGTKWLRDWLEAFASLPPTCARLKRFFPSVGRLRQENHRIRHLAPGS